MERSLTAVPVPAHRTTLQRLLEQCFEDQAGIPLMFEGEYLVPRFDEGGMSSGHVMPAFWREHLIPLILDRAKQAQEDYDQRVGDLLTQAKQLAREYRALTGKPLGITGEVAEFAAAKALGLTLASARETGYDAVRYVDGREIRVQIKGRCLADGAKRGQRVGGIKVEQPWDTVILVLLSEQFEPLTMHEAERAPLVAALQAPGSRARNERGALSIEKFRSIAKLVWASP